MWCLVKDAIQKCDLSNWRKSLKSTVSIIVVLKKIYTDVLIRVVRLSYLIVRHFSCILFLIATSLYYFIRELFYLFSFIAYEVQFLPVFFSFFRQSVLCSWNALRNFCISFILSFVTLLPLITTLDPLLFD